MIPVISKKYIILLMSESNPCFQRLNSKATPSQLRNPNVSKKDFPLADEPIQTESDVLNTQNETSTLIEDLRPKIYKPPARSQSTKPSNKSVSYTSTSTALNTHITNKQDPQNGISKQEQPTGSYNHTPLNNFKNASNLYPDDSMSIKTLKTIEEPEYSQSTLVTKPSTITKPGVKDNKNFVYSTLNINNLIISENANTIKNMLQKRKEGASPTPVSKDQGNTTMKKGTLNNSNLFTHSNTINTNSTFSSTFGTNKASPVKLNTINTNYPNQNNYQTINTSSHQNYPVLTNSHYSSTGYSSAYNTHLSSSQSQQQNSYRSNNSDCLINLEDLMLLEEKLCDIINAISNNRQPNNECFEWWNFYATCSLWGKFENYFKDETAKRIIRDYVNMELLIVMIVYDSSYDKMFLESLNMIIKSVLQILQDSYLLICDYIVSKVSNESLSNVWVYKLKTLVTTKLGHLSNISHSGEIKINNNNVQDYMRVILKNYPQSDVADNLISFFKSLSKLNVNTLNDFFRSKIVRVMNKNASVLASALTAQDLLQMGFMNSVPFPYLKRESFKAYTLVLDLDETLIHFKVDGVDDNKGLLRLRPGLYEFLDSVSKHFELVVFTAATQDVIYYK
jgi:hypothetical protein